MERRIELPLAHDHHTHASLYAAFTGLPDLGVRDAGEALAFLRRLPGDRLNLVRGWRSALLPLTRDDLATLPPLVLVNSSLHGFALSPAALPPVQKLWPELAERYDDRAWGERHLPDLFSFYGRVAGLDSAKLAAFMGSLADAGIGSVEDMTVSGPEALALFGSPPWTGRILSWATPAVWAGLGAGERAACRGQKVFLDGSLGARSAALDAPFLDGETGILVYGDEELEELLAGVAAEGCGLSLHAIGHRAIAQALEILGRVICSGPGFPLVRLEHAQFIDPGQARAARELGLQLSMQPNFNADSTDYADRLRSRHLAENNPFRMLVDTAGFRPGIDLVFGSDGMPHGPEEALRCGLFPPFKGQALSVAELAAGYGPARGTADSYSSHLVDEENQRVRLEHVRFGGHRA